jgi:2-hydroxy-3-oxopropionate reductase
MSVPGPFLPGSRVGFIGLGAMGGGMARCVMRRGFALTVFARHSEAVQALVEAGAQAAESAAAVGRHASLVFLSLPDAAAVDDALFGPEGLVRTLAAGSCVVDTSTIAATSAREFGARLRAQGIWLLDAPVSGGQAGANDGTLGCMVGGDADALAASREALGAFCKTITHAGPLGAGQTIKACNQVAVAGALLGVADALTLARVQGVDPMLMRDVLLGGAARSFSLEKHAPRVIEGKFTPGFRAHLMRKDLRLALETARSGGAELPSAALAEQLLDALCEGGRSDWDWCALALQMQQQAGLDIPAQREPS